MESAIREFVPEDWYGWAGASCFFDGAPPLTLETEAFVAVADPNGVNVLLTDHPQNYFGGWVLDKPSAAQADARKLLVVLEYIGANLTPEILETLGYETL